MCAAPLSVLTLVVSCGSIAAGPEVDDLKAFAREGQVFLLWKESETPSGTTFNVYASSRPITASSLRKARKVGHHIERHSARDCWEDPASFKVGVEASEPVGFLIESGGKRLDPTGGLFVHTVAQNEAGRGYYAVTSTSPEGKENLNVVTGSNSLAKPIVQKPGAIAPIWQLKEEQPSAGTGKKKPLWLQLHGKGGIVKDMEYLVFGTESMGWREGLPFKFSVRVAETAVIVRPTDRTWIGRPLLESWDGTGRTRAIWTFWYGYNSKIYDPDLMSQGVPTNYTERRNLWTLKWVQQYYQTDPERIYCSGSSMGGCGTISFGLRHPEIFAALHAHVPIVSYTQPGVGSARRLEPCCWAGPFTNRVICSDDIPILDRLNGTKLVGKAKGDLPFLFMIHGRRDGSIPWVNNPPFYRAMNDARQGFAVYWDNGEHSTAGKEAPDDVKAWKERFRRFRLDESFPAFSNASTNRNPGDGRPEDGDIIGWMNRGMDWKEIEDERDHYSVTTTAAYPGIMYPVTTDMTLRRVQKFKTDPGERVTVQIGNGHSFPIKADENGRVTISDITIPSIQGVRITLRRSGG